MSAPVERDRRIRCLMADAGIPGVAVADIAQGEVRVACWGCADIEGRRPLSVDTVFDVASLSKPVAAYVALRLTDEGILDPDRPLASYVRTPLPPALAAAPITTRHVLTHTSGLPNLRGDAPLLTHFTPGTRFSYSSVGFVFLQRALESISEAPLESLARRLVFEPLGMTASSFEWQSRFADDVALPHQDSARLDKHRPASAQASYSLQTTATDYGRFLAAVLAGTGLQDTTQRHWLTSAVPVPLGTAENLEGAAGGTASGIGWGSGWGIETTSGCFFQWGKMDGIRAVAMGCPATGAATVLLTNSNRGLRLMEVALGDALPGEHPAFGWMRTCVTE